MSSLGMVGHHVSVFHLDGTDNETTPHIVNSCLAFIHGHFSSRDKLFIREKVCNIFSLDQIKKAREILYTTHDPSKKYKYNGPHSKSDRDRIHDAFEGIYNKISMLDSENKVPIFSVPSNELVALMTSELEDPSHLPCEIKIKQMAENMKVSDAKYKKMESDVEKLHATFNNFVAVVTSNNQVPKCPVPSKAMSIPLKTRKRLISNASKRSASEMSNDEANLPSDISDDEDDDAFVLPKQSRKKARVNSKHQDTQKDKKDDGNNNSNAKPSWSQVAQRKPPPPSTKGKVKSTTAFRGAVPEIFLYNCDVNVTSTDVAEYFQSQSVKVRKVEKKSHQLAARSSFKVTPESKEDYDRILDEDVLPEDMCARQYIFRRGRINSERKDQFHGRGGNQNTGELSNATKKLLKELEALEPTRSDRDSMDTTGEQQQNENGQHSK